MAKKKATKKPAVVAQKKRKPTFEERLKQLAVVASGLDVRFPVEMESSARNAIALVDDAGTVILERTTEDECTDDDDAIMDWVASALNTVSAGDGAIEFEDKLEAIKRRWMEEVYEQPSHVIDPDGEYVWEGVLLGFLLGAGIDIETASKLSLSWLGEGCSKEEGVVMGENTKIEWADDSVNVWWGCTHRGPGCANCYAETFTSRVHGAGAFWGPSKPRLYIASWEKTLRKLNKKAEKAGKPRIVFVNSMSDFFEDAMPLATNELDDLFACQSCGCIASDRQDGAGHIEHGSAEEREGRSKQLLACLRCGVDSQMPLATTDDARQAFFRVGDECPWLRLLLLTKRPENIRKMWPASQNDGNGTRDYSPRVVGVMHSGLRMDNVWLGTSVARQKDMAGVAKLRECTDLAGKLFVSAEPLIEALDFHDQFFVGEEGGWEYAGAQRSMIDWVIVGGESGRGARPYKLEWARSIISQCRDAGVLCFHKQIGSNAEEWDVSRRKPGVGPYISNTIVHVKGGNPDEWDEELRVREMPSL